ncbi:hypothetical protein PH213_13575 [Streptomyces sp. SRF1]|uniref:hypothetical protein n=1 Tax=Streptomyces sp. SRF1 TaxID=1549642 RepID=UPI0025AF5A07|nr:hypothetical protein [Streptomyces sp. SRF1]MDN3055550.1 hypothetical protein [Streptomyces sp. SRF1]
MADTTQPETTEGDGPAAPAASAKPSKPSKDEKRAGRLAHQITAFATSHGGAEGQIAHIGRGTVRIALVGADGEWGVLVASAESARHAAGLAGLTLHDDFDGDLAAKVRTGPYEWTRMAGIQLGGTANPPAPASRDA